MKKNRRTNKKSKANKKEVEITLEQAEELLDKKLGSSPKEEMEKLGGLRDSLKMTNDSFNHSARRTNHSLERIRDSFRPVIYQGRMIHMLSSNSWVRVLAIRLVNGADLRRADLPLYRKIFK